MKTLILALCVALCACATNPATFYLSRPERPILPNVDASEIACLADDVYRRIVIRDAMRRWYAEELESVIDSTRR